MALGLFAHVEESEPPQSPPVATGGLDARALVRTALALIVGGLLAYLPLDIMAARYTIPAVWGCDILLALLFAETSCPAGPLAAPDSRSSPSCVGLAALTVANLGRQERMVARNRLLWQVVHHLEAAPPDTRVEWVADGLGAEEGIHVAWHLRHRGRPDLAVGLVDASRQAGGTGGTAAAGRPAGCCG